MIFPTQWHLLPDIEPIEIGPIIGPHSTLQGVASNTPGVAGGRPLMGQPTNRCYTPFDHLIKRTKWRLI